MSRLSGFFQLMRPANTVLCAFSVLCGGIIGGKPLDRIHEVITGIRCDEIPSWAFRLIFAALSASCVLAAGNAFNDVCDLSCDRINAPNRPLPAGRVSPKAASILAGTLAAAGICFSIPLGNTGILIAFTAVLLLLAYDMKFKGIPLVGNTVVAFLGGLAFIYGGIAGDSGARPLIPAVFATLFHLGRELIKDASDATGDTASGIKTAATVWSASAACRIAATMLFILAIITIIPFFAGYFGPVYFVMMVLGVWPALFYSIVIPLKDTSAKRLLTVSLMLKLTMPVGIIAVLAGFQGW